MPERSHAKRPGLRRELGLSQATLLGIGGTLSAGNFVILGHAAGMAGYSIVIVVIICGIISLFTMFSYCELGTLIPMAGSEYTFAKVAYGGSIAFMTGWFEWISNMFYAALSSLGFAYIISYLIPVNIPLTAVFMILIFTAINIRGVKEAANVESLMTIFVLVILAIYVCNGWLQGPVISDFQLSAPGGLLGMLAATAYLFELYLGAEAIAVVQAEVKDPKKTIPRAMILSSIALIVFYTAITYATVITVPPEILKHQASPIAFAAEQVIGKLGAAVVTIAVAIAGLAAINGAIMAQSRILYALSRDGYFPKALSKIHKRFSTPHIAVIVSSIFTVALASTGGINFVVYAVNFGFIVGFSLVNLSLIKLRKERPRLKRTFKAPLYPFTPIVGIVASLLLILFIEDVGVLILGAELTILALLAYYIRMTGYSRIRIAFGGINLGIGSFALLLLFLMQTGLTPITIPQELATPVFYGLIFLSVTQFLAAALNINGKS